MYELRQLSNETLASALSMAERYRLLNEGEMAESICDDVLAVEPDHQAALVMKILSVSDQLRDRGAGHQVSLALELVGRLRDPYQRVYYEGIVNERRARAHLSQGAPGGGFLAYDWFVAALALFDRAIAERPPGNDDAVLRWNACVRMLRRHAELRPREPEREAVIESE